VSIDGWLNLVNSHPQCDGFGFEWVRREGRTVLLHRTMHRKGSKHATAGHRISIGVAFGHLTVEDAAIACCGHKSMIQAARYAFGFAGIYDEDEGRTIAEASTSRPSRRACRAERG